MSVPRTSLRLNGAPVVTLQDAGHLCWIERADIVNDIITRMVTGA